MIHTAHSYSSEAVVDPNEIEGVPLGTRCEPDDAVGNAQRRIRTMSSGSSGQRLTNPVMSLSIDFLINLIAADFGDWLKL